MEAPASKGKRTRNLGQNVMVKGDKNKDTETEARKVPLCNRCIILYHTKGWLVTREKRNE
jgi:hypothetical protein